ncbi:peptidoglycan binding [Micractinium conductrix]|uniref:Peptidoglycan binding n=1 Tax=Micractinium conductrix TaxID=554055 RepID=A0A2P6V9L6_9CHLO|nr:peptidoglycan binding [Micractinium conductrix]|eukprot:PSC70776.1 peptidoglycan binding [Micractinium conductrix]
MGVHAGALGTLPAAYCRGARPGPSLRRLVARPLAPASIHAAPTVVVATRRHSKVLASGGQAPGGGSPAPYAEALLQREYELWQRQSEMFERLQAQHATDLARFDGERAAWQATEAVLRQEAAELRAQLLFLISQLGAATAAGGGPVVGGAMQQQQQQPAAFSAASQAALVGREPAGALPGGSRFGSSASSPVAAAAGGGPSPGEQVKALVDAMRAGAGRASNGASPASAASSSSSSSSCSSSMPVSAGEAWPQGADSELPDYAAELAAALAAVENTDVLSGLGAYTSAAARRGARAAPAAEHAAPPAPTQHTPPAAAAPAQAAATAPAAAAAAQPAAPEAAANAELAAELAATGPPPMLTVGADDIFWVTQLHTGLVDLGYYPGDEDIDEFMFGEGTLSALTTMQCCEGLAETGIADEASWAKLLGPSLGPKPTRDLTADMMLNVPGVTDKLGGGATGTSSSSGGGGGAQPATAQQQAAKPYTELFTAAFSETVTSTPDGGMQDVTRLEVTDTVAVGDAVTQESVQVSSTTVSRPKITEWPILLEGDGGREVHSLHIALQRAGYYCSEDDERWWTFSDGTMAALKTFQACNGYPESGVCDAATWRLLLGDDADPSEIYNLETGDSADEDLGNQTGDRVWLMGEQRWEDRSRVRRS